MDFGQPLVVQYPIVVPAGPSVLEWVSLGLDLAFIVVAVAGYRLAMAELRHQLDAHKAMASDSERQAMAYCVEQIGAHGHHRGMARADYRKATALIAEGHPLERVSKAVRSVFFDQGAIGHIEQWQREQRAALAAREKSR